MKCHSKVRGSQQPRIRKVNDGAEKRTERGHRDVGIDFGFRNFKNSRRDLEIIYHRELSSHISLPGWPRLAAHTRVCMFRFRCLPVPDERDGGGRKRNDLR